MSELADILIAASDTVFTVRFNKKPNEESIVENIEKSTDF